MEHDVFISYSSKNSDVAQVLLKELQKASVKCWMAPDSLVGGALYEDHIDDAIGKCKIFIIVFSEPAVQSCWVNSELSIAFSSYKHIIPFKIDQTELKGKMKVKLIQSHWIDAYPKFSAKVNELVNSVQATLKAIGEYERPRQDDNSAKVLNFVQRFDLEDAETLFLEKKYPEAIDLLLPLATKGNREAQELLCRVYYRLSVSSADTSIIRSLNLEIKSTIDVIAATGADWANFIAHCYSDTQNDHAASLKFLRAAVAEETLGLAFLRLGIAYGWGLGTAVNAAHAMECYKKAESLDCTEAYSYIGQLIASGYDGHPKDEEKGIEYFKEGVAAKDWRAMKRLNSLYACNRDRHKEGEDFLNKLAEDETPGIEYLFGEYYGVHGILEYSEDSKRQAVEFLEIALKNGHVEAYGDLAILYYWNSEIEKARHYAELGFQRRVHDSYSVLYWLEKEDGNYVRAWEIAQESHELFGTGAAWLGELYTEYGYLPSEDYLPSLIKTLETDARVGVLNSCRCLVTLYSEEKFGLKNAEMEAKYRRMAADLGTTDEEEGGMKMILEYAQFLLVKDSPYYNPMEAVKYLHKAIRLNDVEASRTLLKMFDSKSLSTYHITQYNNARSYILTCGTYDIKEMYNDLAGTPVTEKNADVIRNFYLKAIETFSSRHDEAKFRAIESALRLLWGSLTGMWTLSEGQEAKCRELQKEMDRMISDFLLPVNQDACYNEIISREDTETVIEKDIWKNPLQNIGESYRMYCKDMKITPVTDLSRCKFKDIVPFFPTNLALDYYKCSVHALEQLSQIPGQEKISELIGTDEAMLNFAESLDNMNLQLFLISFVELKLCVEDLFWDAFNLARAASDRDFKTLSSYVEKYINKLNAAGIRHNMTIRDEEELNLGRFYEFYNFV